MSHASLPWPPNRLPPSFASSSVAAKARAFPIRLVTAWASPLAVGNEPQGTKPSRLFPLIAWHP
jgi:hypothetical protein